MTKHPYDEAVKSPAADPGLSREEQMLKALTENNRLLRLQIKSQTQFRWRFFAGVSTGLGTAIGATVVVAILIRLLAFFATVDRIGPYVRDIQEMLERPQAASRAGTADPTRGADANR